MLAELWRYLKVRKKWWLAPSLVLILLTGGLILLGSLTPLGALIYTLF
jgi:hypothetical protein